MKVFTHFTAQEQIFTPEIHLNDISETIPDQAISPEQLIQQYRQTGGVSLNSSPVFDDEGDIPDLHLMDTMDKLHAMQENSHKLKELSNQIDNEKKEFEQMQKAEAQKDELERTQNAEAQATKAKNSEGEAVKK